MPKRPDPKRPVVCFDESPVQLIGEVRQPIPAKPGQLERYDYEYRRNGTVNLFVVLDVHRPWRKVKVTERRAAEDYAQCMRELVDVHYPDAECIRVVQDNLSTHSAGALYQAFPPAEARRILRRLEFHYTPKHASWLNMVEIEIGVLRGQCLDRRIDDPKRLRREIAAWERQQKCRRRPHQMDVHNRQSPRQNGPRLSRHLQRVIITVQRNPFLIPASQKIANPQIWSGAKIKNYAPEIRPSNGLACAEVWFAIAAHVASWHEARVPVAGHFFRSCGCSRSGVGPSNRSE